MGYKLCTTEKQDVATKMANALGATNKFKGYYEGNGYLITWAVGHLVGLAEPEIYGYMAMKDVYENEESREKAYAELPLFPDDFKLVVLPNTQFQFQVINSLMHRDDVDYIIDCGDTDDEGHILQWFIREAAKNDKPVKRFCATTSLTEGSIIDGMNHLRDINDFTSIIRGEFCKKKADWVMGMSLSRAESIKYHTGINVGRVQSPTLYFVYKRWKDNKSFKVTDYFTLKSELSEGFNVQWQKDNEGIFSPSVKDGENRVLDRAAVQAKGDEIQAAGAGTITELASKKRGNERPQLFSATDLQREASKKYGYAPDVTLATSEALYLRDIMSYPRTSSNYITEDLAPSLESLVRIVSGIPKYTEVCNKLLADGLNVDKRIVDNEKVDGHHALIPIAVGLEKLQLSSQLEPNDTERKQGVSSETMKNILDLCLCRFVLALSSPYIYEQTSITVTFNNGMKFAACGNKPLQMGWKGVEKTLWGKNIDSEEAKDENEQMFPALSKGQKVNVKTITTIAKKTTPPPLLTYDTLLEHMGNAGTAIENGAILKGKGIGTDATRAGIIKKLFDSGVVESTTKGKTKYIVPTSKGVSVIQVLPQELYSPKITADWETRIAGIVDGTVTEEEFLREFKHFINEKVDEIKTSETKLAFKKERISYGKCPWCLKDASITQEERDNAEIYCYDKKDDAGKLVSKWYYCSRKCGFGIDTANKLVVGRTGRKLTELEVKKLIIRERVGIECKKTNGGNYRGEFTVEQKNVDGKIYCNLHFEFANKK